MDLLSVSKPENIAHYVQDHESEAKLLHSLFFFFLAESDHYEARHWAENKSNTS
jgi:hypothetical protein